MILLWAVLKKKSSEFSKNEQSCEMEQVPQLVEKFAPFFYDIKYFFGVIPLYFLKVLMK